MDLGVIVRCGWPSYSWAEFWPLHYFSLLSWSLSRYHLFSPTISAEEICCHSIPNNCHGMLISWCICWLLTSPYNTSCFSDFFEKFCMCRSTSMEKAICLISHLNKLWTSYCKCELSLGQSFAGIGKMFGVLMAKFFRWIWIMIYLFWSPSFYAFRWLRLP